MRFKGREHRYDVMPKILFQVLRRGNDKLRS